MGAQRPEVVPAVGVRLELEQRLVMRVVRRVLAERGPWRGRLGLRGQDRLRVCYLLHLLQQLRLRLDPGVWRRDGT